MKLERTPGYADTREVVEVLTSTSGLRIAKTAKLVIHVRGAPTCIMHFGSGHQTAVIDLLDYTRVYEKAYDRGVAMHTFLMSLAELVIFALVFILS